MYPFNACRPDAKEGIKRVSGRLNVLVRTEGEGVKPNESEHDKRHLVGRKQEDGYGCHYSKGTRNHPTIDADEGIGIVQLHHQIG